MRQVVLLAALLTMAQGTPAIRDSEHRNEGPDARIAASPVPQPAPPTPPPVRDDEHQPLPPAFAAMARPALAKVAVIPRDLLALALDWMMRPNPDTAVRIFYGLQSCLAANDGAQPGPDHCPEVAEALAEMTKEPKQ